MIMATEKSRGRPPAGRGLWDLRSLAQSKCLRTREAEGDDSQFKAEALGHSGLLVVKSRSPKAREPELFMSSAGNQCASEMRRVCVGGS